MTKLTLDEYQIAAGRTDGNHDADYYALLLTAEAGEVAALFQKIRHGKPLDVNQVVLEVGDVLWACAGLLSKYDISLEQAAALNLRKLAHRHPNGFQPITDHIRDHARRCVVRTGTGSFDANGTPVPGDGRDSEWSDRE